MYRIIEKGKFFHIQKKTFFGWSYLISNEVEYEKVYIEYYHIYLLLFISIFSLILSYIIFPNLLSILLMIVSISIGLIVAIRLMSYKKYYRLDLKSTKEKIKLFELKEKEKKEKPKIHYTNIESERIAKLGKIR